MGNCWRCGGVGNGDDVGHDFGVEGFVFWGVFGGWLVDCCIF